MSGEERGFKIVDRRRFTEDGDEREGAPEDVEPAVVIAADPSPPTQAAPSPAQPEPEEVQTEGGLTLSIFVQSLAQQAMMQMGLVAWPHTGERALQLEQARDTVDVLELLAVKTKGNLTKEEKQLLDTVLYELRMTFVEINNQIAAAATKGGPPGQP